MVDSTGGTIYATQCQGCIEVFIDKAQTVEAVGTVALTQYLCQAVTVTSGSASAPVDVRSTTSTTHLNYA